MTPLFQDLVVGGVMFAPILTYLVLTAVIILALQPLLRWSRFTSYFVNPELTEFSLYVSIFGLVTLLY